MKKIDFMLTAFRDGFQSVYGARVFSKDYLPVVKACADAGITHFEAGGGALFQSPFFYCNENAFDVMDAFRKAAAECERSLDANLPIAAYEQAIKASHTFNLLQARGVISVQERASYIGRVRDLAKGSCEAWMSVNGWAA